MEVKRGYKQTEVGIIPEDWVVLSLGELGSFKNGINKGAEDFGHGSPFINLMDVFGIPKVAASTANLGLVDSTEAEQRLYELRSGDVLFVRSSVKPEGVGLTSLILEDLPGTVFSGFLIRFRDYGQLTLQFKEHCFFNDGFRRRLIANSTVSANTNINQDALKRLQIGFPLDTTEQRAIAKALSDMDALLGGLDRLIAKKRDVKLAAMQQLFTGQTRLPGFHDIWEMQRLGDLGTFLKGSGVRKDEAKSGNLPCIRYGEIYTHHNNYIKSFNSWISPEVAATATRLRRGDLLFAGSGETKEEIGKCVAFVDDCEAYAGGDTVILRLSEANPMFMGYYCNIGPINAQKASKGQGDAVVHISAAALSSILVSLPTVPEQTAIAAVLSDMDTELAVLETRRDKTRALKQGMMQKLLTGGVRLV